MNGDESEPSAARLAIFVSIVSVLGLIGCYFWSPTSSSVIAQLAFAFFQVSTVSIVIWQACDPFADAAQYLGEQWRIPGSVRGATLDAVASSLPELFTGLFFVLLVVLSDQPVEPGDGFGATIATCAGSAVYNMILIPAFCGIAIAFSRKRRPYIQVDKQVIFRDGLWFLICELVLVAFLFQSTMGWPAVVTLLSLYVVYLVWLGLDARKHRRLRELVVQKLAPDDTLSELTDESIAATFKEAGIHANDSLIDNVRREIVADDGDHEEEAEFCFGLFSLPLTITSAGVIIVASTLVTAAACYWLVNITESLAVILNIPVFFVAVIVAAAASSVPDTFLSIASAKRGDDDGAVSNAFGSNIFDICICLSVPLIAALMLNAGEPISLAVDGKPMPGLFGLQILMVCLTTITLAVLLHRMQLTLAKSIFLVFLYTFFIGYAVVGSLQY
jgi:cation:H+ antiporter